MCATNGHFHLLARHCPLCYIALSSFFSFYKAYITFVILCFFIYRFSIILKYITYFKNREGL